MFSNDDILAHLANQPSLRAEDRQQQGEALMKESPTRIAAYLAAIGPGHRPTVSPTAMGPLAPASKLFTETNHRRYHLIYAYLVENTRLYELFGRVIAAFNDGETLGVADPATRAWLETTEMLFYRQQDAHDHTSAVNLTSDARSDGRAIRRNAYFRMFGMDLNHGTDANQPYAYPKPKVANSEFVSSIEALMRQIWTAFVYQGATTGNPTDPAEIMHLTRRLQTMLSDRRINGTLTREEFSAVATLDWLRLAISFDSPVVRDLRAQATTEHERVRKIAERVGLPAHGMSEDYLELSWRMAAFLIGIETNAFTSVQDYLNFPPMNDIIHHWARATGKVLKRLPQPVVRDDAA